MYTGGFEVNVRNADVALKRLDDKMSVSAVARMVINEIATILSVLSLFVLIMITAGFPTAAPFLLSGVLVYMGIIFLRRLNAEKVWIIVSIILAVVLIAALVVFRRFIGNGFALTMNQLYEESEAVQAYIYRKFITGDIAYDRPDMCTRLAAAWLGALTGVIAAVPTATIRRIIGLAMVCISMLAFAYYGLIPSAVGIALTVLVLTLMLARGGLLSTLPVILISFLIFGAVMLISPGENYGISRMDENFRDRFALKSAYLESEESVEPIEDLKQEWEKQEQEIEENESFVSQNKVLTVVFIIILILLALAAAAFLLYKNYMTRRSRNRAGIYSEDNREAIVAMFPYANKWLKAGDIDVADRSFADINGRVREEISGQYADYYSDMYKIWSEAAYSDHEMDEEGRSQMEDFVEDTKELVTSGKNLGMRIWNAFKYAL